jgi:cyclopropane fatty-acyl-phospholipid synthase-like methyltransferase
MIDKELWNVFYHLNPDGGPWDHPDGSPDQHVVDFIKWADEKKDSKILDVGCGYGKNSKYLLQEQFSATGVDISKFAINKCLETMPSGNFLPIDILENNFSNEEFDAIIDAGAMHVNEPKLHKDFFKEYYRLLKPRKPCFIRIFNQLENTEKPIFFVYLRMPVYGSTVENIKNLIADLFDIEHIEYDPDYGMHGLGCNYFYLRKK